MDRPLGPSSRRPPLSHRPSRPGAGRDVGGGADRALTKLKGLLDSGVLTQEQFEAEKAKLLPGS